MIDPKEYSKQWHLNHKKSENEKAIQYYYDNLEKIKVQRKQYCIDNKEKIKECKRKWRQNNVEYMKEYYQDNAEKIKARVKAYRQTGKGKATKQRSKLARKKQAEGVINTLTSEEWINILKQYKFRCAYCDCEFTLFNRETKDHVLPISKGGDNTKENVVPACRSCNSKKYNKIIEKEPL